MKVSHLAHFDQLPSEVFAYTAVKVNAQGTIVEQLPGQGIRLIETLGEGIPLEVVLLPGGAFEMGAGRGEGTEEERPRHLVYLAPFGIGRSLVTQDQWRAVMGKLPFCRFKGGNLPVDGVSWTAAREFCRRLSSLTGHNYGLPSEAQWEFACRAGTQTPFSTGETITTDLANYVGAHIFRNEPPGVYRHEPTPGGTFPPNGWGLFDLHGNLWEWCADRWHPDYTGAPFDGKPWEEGGELGYRVARGGSWHETPGNCRSAVRLRVNERDGDECSGVRVALVG